MDRPMYPPMGPPMEQLSEEFQRKIQQIARDLLKEYNEYQLQEFTKNLSFAEKTAVTALIELSKGTRRGSKKKRVVKKKI